MGIPELQSRRRKDFQGKMHLQTLSTTTIEGSAPGRRIGFWKALRPPRSMMIFEVYIVCVLQFQVGTELKISMAPPKGKHKIN